MLTIIPKTDALFTVVVVKAETGDFCSKTEISISTGFLGASTVVSIFVIIAYCVLAYTQDKLLAILTAIFCSVCLPAYMLADNLQPHDCFLECDTNATRNDLECDGNSGARLGLIGFALILLVTLMILIPLCRRRNQNLLNSPSGEELFNPNKTQEEDSKESDVPVPSDKQSSSSCDEQSTTNIADQSAHAEASSSSSPSDELPQHIQLVKPN